MTPGTTPSYLNDVPGAPGIGEILASPPTGQASSNVDSRQAEEKSRNKIDLEKIAMRTVLEYEGSWQRAREALDALEANHAADFAIQAGGIECAKSALEKVK